MGQEVKFISRYSSDNGISTKAYPSSNITDRFYISESSLDRPGLGKGGLGEGFSPKVNEKSSKKNYATTQLISGQTIDEIVRKMNKTVHLENMDKFSDPGVQSTFKQSVAFYNRFKVANPNAPLQKGFAHVFFVRPDCNLIDETGKKLIEDLTEHELFKYAWNHTPELLQELVQKNGKQNHDFMFSISNASASFSPNDEYINTDSYGKTFTGYRIAYGKNNTESKTAGTFNITFRDDRNLHIYQLHRLWVEYINGVYRGQLAPKKKYIFDKILDYATSCYYIVTAEDGETIIFWTKYYGVFPTTIPVGQYSWAEGNIINQTSLDISYQYSFKEDFNPYSLTELNYNSRISSSGINYIPVFDKNLGHVGRTWVGAPFIELIESKGTNNPYMFKLRFKPN